MSPERDDAAGSGEGRGVGAQQGSDQRGNGSPNAAAAQRARILAHLQRGQPLTTIQARRDLDVLHPGARLMELRRAGWPIVMTWVREATDAGRLHRVGRYWLEVRS